MTGIRGAAALTRGVRYLAALMLVCTGVVHMQQYLAGFDVVPIIGPLFVANFVLGVGLGLALFAPIERIPRFGGALLDLTAAGGFFFALGTIAALEISKFGALFGFHESGYRAAVVLSLVFEACAAVLIAIFWGFRARAGSAPAMRRRRTTKSRGNRTGQGPKAARETARQAQSRRL